MPPVPPRILVVAGEPSGDRALALVIAALAREDADTFGLGGDALLSVGTRLLGHVRELSGMGVAELGGRAPAIARALSRLVREVIVAPPTVALLASWSAANARIGSLLRRIGVPVMWISPPEVWAWGAFRAPRLARSADRMVVTLPFEEASWRAAGADARYLGHPSLDAPIVDRDKVRLRLGFREGARAVALLPGSRAAEVTRLLPPFLEAARKVHRTRGIELRLLLAPSLPYEVYESARRSAEALRIGTLDCSPLHGAGELLPAFDAALVASGTASLECALAGAPPVIAYQLHPLTMFLARRLVSTRRIALPNVVLQRDAFPELVQEQVTPKSLAEALERVLEDQAAHDACREVAATMRASIATEPSTWGARAAAVVRELAPAVSGD